MGTQDYCMGEEESFPSAAEEESYPGIDEVPEFEHDPTLTGDKDDDGIDDRMTGNKDNLDDKPLFSGSTTTVGAAMLQLALFVQKHNVTSECISHLLLLLQVLLPNENLFAKTYSQYQNYFTAFKNQFSLHYYCSSCLQLVPEWSKEPTLLVLRIYPRRMQWNILYQCPSRSSYVTCFLSMDFTKVCKDVLKSKTTAVMMIFVMVMCIRNSLKTMAFCQIPITFLSFSTLMEPLYFTATMCRCGPSIWPSMNCLIRNACHVTICYLLACGCQAVNHLCRYSWRLSMMPSLNFPMEFRYILPQEGTLSAKPSLLHALQIFQQGACF